MDSMGYQTKPNYVWNWNSAADENTAILCLPQLEVYYKKYEDGTWVDKKILVPLVYYYTIGKDGGLTPVSVEFSFNDYCATTLETVNKTMQDISGERS